MNFNLTQIVEAPTRDRNILDLCFVSHPSLVEYCNVIPGISDHDAVIVKTKMTARAVRPPKRKIFLYKKADLHSIDEVLSSFNEKLSEEYVTAIDINELWLDFKQVLSKAMDRYLPSKMSSTRHNLYPGLTQLSDEQSGKIKNSITRQENLGQRPPGQISRISGSQQTDK